jgi:hypothetical protein
MLLLMEDRTVQNKEFSIRFTEAVDFLQFKRQAEFAREIDISTPSLTQYLKNGIKPSGEITLKLIQKFPNVNWYYVYFGEGKIDEEMPLSNQTLMNQIKELEIQNLKLKNEIFGLEKDLQKEKSTNELLQKMTNLIEKYDKKLELLSNQKS